MDIELFEEFSMIAKSGNLSSAARELHITQPALSRHLSALEKRFGVALFDRSTTPMKLTPEGESFLHWASVISNSYRKMVDSMDALRGKDRHVLAVTGMTNARAAVPFKNCCRRLKEEDALFTVNFESSPLQTPFDLIREGQMDIAIEPFSVMSDTHGVESVRLGTERSYVLMEKTNPLSCRTHLGIEDIRVGRFTSLRTNQDYANRKHLQGICHEHGFAGDVPGNLETCNADTYQEILFAGLEGRLLMLPESVAQALVAEEHDEVVALPVEDRSCDYDFRVFHSPQPSKTAIALLEQLSAEVG